MKKPNTILTAILPALACFALLPPKAFGVVPPPDGGYPGGNTAEGQNALLSLTAGVHNTAVGYLSLKSDTTGGYNTAVGSGTLFANTGDGNTATGVFALLSNTDAAFNTANGALALFSNTTGSGNTASGFGALENNIDGNNNGALGTSALLYHETGDYNYAIGSGALEFNVSGIRNTAVGHAALRNSTGSNNIAIGTEAGVDQTTGPNNIYIGDLGVPGEDNVIAIGAVPASGIPYTDCYIGGIFGSAGVGVDIGVTETGRIGPFASSARFKDDIKPMEKASEAIFRLRPVTFRYKKKVDAKGGVQFGFVAEEVAKVNPELVVSDGDGKPYSVRYRDVTAMLLNEFLKEHKTVQELKKQIAALRAAVREQDSKMQRITNQLQLTQPAPQLVDNNQ